MSLSNGLDLTAIATLGVYSDTYNSATGAENIANLYVSYGYLEDAPGGTGATTGKRLWDWFWEFF